MSNKTISVRSLLLFMFIGGTIFIIFMRDFRAGIAALIGLAAIALILRFVPGVSSNAGKEKGKPEKKDKKSFAIDNSHMKTLVRIAIVIATLTTVMILLTQSCNESMKRSNASIERSAASISEWKSAKATPILLLQSKKTGVSFTMKKTDYGYMGLYRGDGNKDIKLYRWETNISGHVDGIMILQEMGVGGSRLKKCLKVINDSYSTDNTGKAIDGIRQKLIHQKEKAKEQVDYHLAREKKRGAVNDKQNDAAAEWAKKRKIDLLESKKAAAKKEIENKYNSHDCKFPEFKHSYDRREYLENLWNKIDIPAITYVERRERTLLGRNYMLLFLVKKCTCPKGYIAGWFNQHKMEFEKYYFYLTDCKVNLKDLRVGEILALFE